MVDLQGMHFNAKKAFYINFQKHAPMFFKAMLSTTNGGGNGLCYVLPTNVCDTKNNYLIIEDRYRGLIYQHALENILNVFQWFIKSLHQPTKSHGLVGQFPNRQKGNKEVYDYFNAFIHQLREDIGEPITTRYIREINSMTTIYDNYDKVFLPHHTSKHKYCTQWCFERG